MNDKMNRSFLPLAVYVLLAVLHLFQKGIYLFGPEQWLSPEIMRTYSFWQLLVDWVSGGIISVLGLPEKPQMIFASVVVLDFLICLLLIGCTRIFGKKFLFMAFLVALPLFTVMPGPDPTLTSSHIAAIVLWIAWCLTLIAAVGFAFRHQTNGANLVFVVLLALLLAIAVPGWSFGDAEIEIPIGLMGGIALIMIYSLRMIKEKRRQAHSS